MRSSRRKSTQQNVSSVFPTDVKNQPIQTRVLRYVVTGTTAIENDTIYVGNLLSLLCVALGGNTTGCISLIKAVRIDQIKIWGVSTVSSVNPLNFTKVSLTWRGIFGQGAKLVAYGNSEHPSKIVASPPPASDAAQWHNRTDATLTTPLMEIDAPSGSIIDLHFSYVLDDGTTATIVTGKQIGRAHV